MKYLPFLLFLFLSLPNGLYATLTVSLGADTVICHGDSLLLDAGPGLTNYAWSNGSTSQSIWVFNGGTYTITVTDNTGCTASDTIVVDVPVLVIRGDSALCPNISILLSADPGFTSYLWSAGATTSHLLVNMQGTYSITASHTVGCMDTASITVTALPAPVFSLGADTTLCPGESLILDPGPNLIAYFWSDNSTNSTLTVSSGGTYYVAASDSNSCIGRDTIQVSVSNLSMLSLGPDAFLCDGESILLDAGPGFVSYQWSGGSSGQTLSASMAGGYDVTVTDSNGCTVADTFQLTVFPVPQPDIGPDTTICPGDFLFLDAGPGFDSYIWTTGSTTQQTIAALPGTYIVFVSDLSLSSCIGSDTLQLQTFPGGLVDLGPDLEICQGDSLLLDAGSGFLSYTWSTTESTQSIFATTADGYFVSALDANGCLQKDTMVLGVNSLPMVNLGSDFSTCEGSGFNLDAGSGFVSYLWNTGETTSAIIPDSSGTFSVTVTDTNGCNGFDDMMLTVFPTPSPDLGPDTGICMGASLMLDAGPGFTSYLWPNGSTIQTFSVNAAGTYAVTVTDGNGCIGSDAIQVNVFALPLADLGADTILCDGDFILLSAGPGQGAYVWSDGSTGSSVLADSTANYSFTVTDGNGCMASDTALVTVQAPLPLDLGVDLSYCEGTVVLLDAGAGFATYDWSTGATTQSILVDSAGFYSLTVTDAAACMASDLILIAFTGFPTVSLGPDRSFCQGDTVILDGGPFPGGYLWSDGTTNQSLAVVSPGLYSISVSDANGCLGMDSVFVNEWALPVVGLGSDTTTCEGITLHLDAGAGYPGYAWSDGSTTQSINVSLAGIYSVTVTDNNGCMGSDTLLWQQFPSPVADFIFSQNGFAVSFSDNSAFAVGWHWDFGDGDTSNQPNPFHTYSSAGMFTACLTVTNADGCTDSFCETLDIITAIDDELFESELAVYPNPASDVVYIRTDFTVSRDLRIRLLSMDGKSILADSYPTISRAVIPLQLPSLSAGLYALQIESEGVYVVKKLFISR